MAGNALRLEAQDFMPSSDDLSVLAKRFLVNDMPDRPPGSRAWGSFAVPLSTLKLPFRLKNGWQWIQMDIHSPACRNG
jgi:hypothetical protein